MKCTHHNDIFRNTGIWYQYHSLGLLCLYDDAVLSFCNQSDPKVLRISLIQVSKADALHLCLEDLNCFQDFINTINYYLSQCRPSSSTPM